MTGVSFWIKRPNPLGVWINVKIYDISAGTLASSDAMKALNGNV
jgi:hypothetical protein